jgi:hypothetical protein
MLSANSCIESALGLESLGTLPLLPAQRHCDILETVLSELLGDVSLVCEAEIVVSSRRSSIQENAVQLNAICLEMDGGRSIDLS